MSDFPFPEEPPTHPVAWELFRTTGVTAAQYKLFNRAMLEMQAETDRFRRALELAAVRLEILTGRMRACHEETGKHELLEEAEAFCREVRESLK